MCLSGGFFLRKGIRVSYAGARAGNLGGPLVKIQRLRVFFPEARVFFSHVYLLSNSPYLPNWALKWLKWRRVPIVLNQNGVFYPAWFDGDWEAKNKEMAKAWHLADYVFYQSEFCRRSAEKFLGTRSGPGEVLYNAVDLNKFKPSSNRINKLPVLLHTGKLVPHMFYRVEALLRGFELACKNGLNAELRIAGWMDARLERQAMDLLRELSLQDCVAFTGAYDQNSAPLVYSGADAYVTLTYNDACPSAVIEALACGLPVLYSNSGGVPELVSQTAGVGLDVDVGYKKINLPSRELIAKGINDVLTNLPARQIAARKRAEQAFDIRHWINRHSVVFSDLSRKR
jgi:glycosyltransferase involved in cell wall biosynthesis